MTLTPGSRLGSYDIVAPLGAGGMGEVYRAIDTSLGRQVAIKVLPEDVAADPERLARFQREARTLASLNHPNIAQIYGLEKGDASGPGAAATGALVMELVEGPTLADRIGEGPIPLDDALPIAGQIADALEAAHEQGIIHRDLKPANVKLRPDGVVKVLDFGLAKILEPAGALSASVTQSPTITSPALVTGAGMLLGTAAYMSPEQTKGRAADKRSDVWAFGCVLYEMLTGARPFEGEDINDTIASIRRGAPDWTRLPSGTPAAIRRLLRRCLEKDRHERLPDIGAARLDVKEARANVDVDPADRATDAVSSSRTGARVAWILATVTSVVALGLAVAVYRRAPSDRPVYRSSIVVDPTTTADPAGRIAISPDGRRLAFLASDASNRRTLWVRALDGLTAQPLAGTEDATYPFWSPDSRFIAFSSGGKLKKIEAAGGPALTICDSQSFGPGTWSRDDVIVFAPGQKGPLHRVHAGGGTPQPVLPFDETAGEIAHLYPFFLPDGRHFLYSAYRANGPAGLFVTSIDDPRHIRLMDGGANAAYAQGFLLFLRDRTLLAQPFDADALALSGDARPVAEQVITQPLRAGTFSVSQSGALVYQAGDRTNQLAWTNRQGVITGTVNGDRMAFQTVQLSPDGTRAAITTLPGTGDGEDIWIIDLIRKVPMRLTTDPGTDRYPVWSPDGSRIVFQSNRNGVFDLYQRSSSGAGTDEVLWADSMFKAPTSWSDDGRFILYSAGSDIWVLPLETAAAAGPARVGERKPFRFIGGTPFAESAAEFSPDGRMVAYTSDESGQPQVYVTPFPGAEARWPISSGAGIGPRWRRDGKELFYQTQPGGVLTAAAVSSAGSRLEIGAARPLFPSSMIVGVRRRWDAAPDGQLFLVVQDNAAGEIAGAASLHITLVVNWQAALGAPDSR